MEVLLRYERAGRNNTSPDRAGTAFGQIGKKTYTEKTAEMSYTATSRETVLTVSENKKTV